MGKDLVTCFLKTWFQKGLSRSSQQKFLWPIRQLSEVFWFGDGIAIHDLGTLISSCAFFCQFNSWPKSIPDDPLRSPVPTFSRGGGKLDLTIRKVRSWAELPERKTLFCLCWFISTTSSWWFQVSTQLKNMSQIGPFQLFWFNLNLS